jgi:hypothetical protein
MKNNNQKPNDQRSDTKNPNNLQFVKDQVNQERQVKINSTSEKPQVKKS